MVASSRARRVVALAAVAAMAFSACGSNDSADKSGDADTEASASESGDASKTSEASESGDASEASESSGDAIKIPVWVAFTDYRLDWTKNVAANFNSQVEGYEVEVTGFDSYEALFEATVGAINQVTPPAVVQYFEAATQEARDAVDGQGNKVFANIEDLIDGRSEILGVPVVIDDVVKAAKDYYTLDGTFTSMPWNTSSAIMFVNRSLLDAAGVEGTPTTWAELEAACETFMASSAATDACVTWPNHGWFTEQSVAQQGATLVNNDNGRSARATEVQLDSDAVVDYVSWWKEMQDKGYYVYTGTQNDWGGTYDLFAAQNIPFLIYSSSDTTALTDEGKNGGFVVEAAFMPHNQDRAEGGNIIGGATNWVVDGLDQATTDGAVAFVNFLSNPENAADWHRQTGYIPITNSGVALLEEEGWFDENPNSRVANAQLDAAPSSAATAGALVGNFVAIRTVVTGAIEDILVNDLDPATRMAEAQKEAQKLLDEYNLLYAD